MAGVSSNAISFTGHPVLFPNKICERYAYNFRDMSYDLYLIYNRTFVMANLTMHKINSISKYYEE